MKCPDESVDIVWHRKTACKFELPLTSSLVPIGHGSQCLKPATNTPTRKKNAKWCWTTSKNAKLSSGNCLTTHRLQIAEVAGEAHSRERVKNNRGSAFVSGSRQVVPGNCTDWTHCVVDLAFFSANRSPSGRRLGWTVPDLHAKNTNPTLSVRDDVALTQVLLYGAPGPNVVARVASRVDVAWTR